MVSVPLKLMQPAQSGGDIWRLNGSRQLAKIWGHFMQGGKDDYKRGFCPSDVIELFS